MKSTSVSTLIKIRTYQSFNKNPKRSVEKKAARETLES